MNRLLLICLAGIGYISTTNAQQQGYVLSGEIINSKFEPLAFVNIGIKSKIAGTISKPDGKFAIELGNSDTLVFSSIGYRKLEMPVSQLNKEYNYIVLQEEIYELAEIDVFDARWKDFKFEMMNTELQPLDQKVIVIEGLPDPFVKMVPVSLVGSPISFIYEYFKRENVIKRKHKRWTKIYRNSAIRVE